ncbi:MAG: phosphoenolpyruvate--protein phosphotransferase [Rhodocyclaceae bacterium]
MSFALHGLAVSSGIAIGHAHRVSHALLEVPHYVLPAKHVEAELARFDAALAEVRRELGMIRDGAGATAPQEIAALVGLHAIILDDPLLAQATRELIAARRCNAEWALVQQMEELSEQFERIEDPYLRSRKADIVQVVERVLKFLMGRPGQPVPGRRHDRPAVVVARDLSPADTVQFKQHQIAGFITDLGGATSHTAIVARSLGIPAVVGLREAGHLVREDELLIVDGTRGVVIVDPDERVLEEYRLRKSELDLDRARLRRLRSAAATTLDGQAISLQANIELPRDLVQVREAGADGVGLFRTEFLFFNRAEFPGEDEQFDAYRRVAHALKGKPVTIRILDVGADKTTGGASESRKPNPALGLRAIRYCLSEPQMFLAQLRAILRASHYGRVRLLIPMLAHAHEIDQSMALIQRAKEQLRAEKVPFDEGMEIGGMIEIPAAALALGVFLKRLDFLSIGTNDLIQYTLAIDRTDETVAHLYDCLHPSILYLIHHTIQSAARASKPVALCGEMAGDPMLTRLLLGMGLREFSMHPSQINIVKQQVLRANVAELGAKVAALLRVEEPARLREQLARLNEPIG